MILTAKDIAEITRLLDESHFSELKLEIGEFRLRISRGGAAPRDDYGDEFHSVAAPAPTAEKRAAPADGPGKGEADVPSPLLGNFYHSPRPGDPPFVEPGDSVSEDTTIGIVEVMKLMNPIRAGVAGTVVAFLAANGTAVERDQPLLRVKVG